VTQITSGASGQSLISSSAITAVDKRGAKWVFSRLLAEISTAY
jgi:hypothetical protein